MEQGEKAFMGRTYVSLGKTNRFLEEQKGDKKSVIIFVYVGANWSFHLLHDHETPPEGNL